MKKIIIFVVILIGCLGIYKAAATVANNNSVSFTGGKVLVAYYSYSGNTKAVAQKIQAVTGGNIFEIKTKTQYPKDYDTMTTQVQNEIKTGKLPELQNNGDVSEYNIIFVGTPVWWGTVSLPVKTFLVKNDFSGKTIIPFCTHGGGGEGSTFRDMQKLVPQGRFLEGLSGNGNPLKTADVQKWIKHLKTDVI